MKKSDSGKLLAACRDIISGLLADDWGYVRAKSPNRPAYVVGLEGLEGAVRSAVTRPEARC